MQKNETQFTKYVPPHMRQKEKRRNRKNKNSSKKSSNDYNIQQQPQIDIQDNNQFPALMNVNNDDNNNINHERMNNCENENWIMESKRNAENYINYNEETIESTFQHGNLSFKIDKNVKDGWIVLNKDTSLNRGNCHAQDLIPLSIIERQHEYINYITMRENMSRNSEGIPLIPKHSTPFEYDTDEDIDNNNEEYLGGECDNNNVYNEVNNTNQENNENNNSDYSDNDDDY